MLQRVRFERIKITGGQADSPDPRGAPAVVASIPPELLKDTPTTITGTDKAPTVALVTLEGTAGQTVTVQPWVLDEPQGKPEQADDPKSGDAARKFYSFGNTVVVTVGAVSSIPICPGRIYYRLTAAPAADATLKIGFT